MPVSSANSSWLRQPNSTSLTCRWIGASRSSAALPLFETRERDAAAVAAVDPLVNHAELHEALRHQRDEGAREIEVIGHRLHVHVAVERQMRDRDQHRVFDAGKPDRLAVAGADAFVMRGKAEQRMHQMAEFPVAAVGQKLRARGGERDRAARAAHRTPAWPAERPPPRPQGARRFRACVSRRPCSWTPTISKLD